MSHDVIYANGREIIRNRAYSARPIPARIYNSTLVKWLVVDRGEDGGAHAPVLLWTGDRDCATTMESFAAETLARALKVVSDQLGMGWEAVYAEPTKGWK